MQLKSILSTGVVTFVTQPSSVHVFPSLLSLFLLFPGQLGDRRDIELRFVIIARMYKKEKIEGETLAS